MYLLTALIEHYTVLLAYLDLFTNYVGGRAQQGFGRAWALPGMSLATPLFKTNVSHVSHVSAILGSDYSCFMHMAYNSGIILAKIVTYYS